MVRGENVLLMAPTGTGKTEAALLPILSRLISDPDVRPVAALYITPLRALNRDLLERVEWWCQRLDVSVAVRHGDTDSRERRAHALIPPYILIITPEALQSLLIGRVIRRHLANTRWIVIDEVHELATDKRGEQLSVAIQRLRRIAGRDFQIIGLSATVGSADEVARFLVGADGRCSVINASMARGMEVTILFPQPGPGDREIAEALGIALDVASRLRTIRQLVESHDSTLIFTNTRPLAETLANRFKAWSETYPVSIHHGSLSRDKRLHVERELKHGQLSGLICTSSLEMGIDIGRVDLCIQYNSPREVSRLVQRVGRSGHSVGRVARGVIIVMDSDDALEAMVIARRASRGLLEPAAIPRNSLDVAMHQVAGLLIEYQRVSRDEILGVLRGSYNYRDFSQEELADVLSFMSSIGLARVDEAGGWASRPGNQKRLFDYYFSNLSMIPEERQYLVVDEERGEPVGILDESFVAEYGEPGTRFILAGRPWLILSMSGDRIYVASLVEGEGAVPSWVGDEIPVPLEVAQEVGEVRRRYVEMRRGSTGGEAAARLASEYGVPLEDMARSMREVEMHLEMGIPVPTDRHVVVEKAGDFTIIHLCGGLRINRTIARMLATFLAERIGSPVNAQSDPYRVVLRSRYVDAESVVEALREMSFEEVFTKAVESSGVFKRRLIHVARKMGVIEREASIVDVSMQQLLSSLRDTAAYREAFRYTVFSDYDREGAETMLSRIRSGETALSIYRGGSPSPLASLTINRYLYEFESYAPERLRRVVLNAVRGRLMSERVVLLCTSCLGYASSVEVGDLETRPSCPECGSQRLGVLKRPEMEALGIVSKRGRNLSGEERRMLRTAEKTAELVERYGKAAVAVLSARDIPLKEAAEILSREPHLSPRLIELVIEAEKKRLLDVFR